MTITKPRFFSKLKNFGIAEFVQVSNIIFIFLVYAVLILGVLGSILIIAFPAIDDIVLKNLLSGILVKYENLDDTQKNQIKDIFQGIFLDTSTPSISITE